MFDPQTTKKDFSIFQHHPNLVYLDSAATSLKPQAVIDAEQEYLSAYSTNVGRGLYPLAEIATGHFEAVRAKTARFIGAKENEIIFTSGTTASINLAAQLLGQSLFSVIPASEPESSLSGSPIESGMTRANIVVTELEHHSNFLPWKELAKRTGAAFRIAPIDAEGSIDSAALLDLIDEHTALVAFSAVSNVTGAVSDVPGIIKAIRVKRPETIILVDAAQAIAHIPIDVSDWDADFIAFSAHKAFGPTGVGILYGKAALLETLPPVSFGGGMVLDTNEETPEYKEIPYRFEAGTPNIGGVIAFGAALDWIKSLGNESSVIPGLTRDPEIQNLDSRLRGNDNLTRSFQIIREHETKLVTYAIKKLKEAFKDTLRIIGPESPEDRSGIIAFSFENIHPHDIAHLLGESDICVRAGEHCAAPLHRALGLTATTRVSFSVYNDINDVDRLIEELKKIKALFS
jgi:cysteine desulfurase/selenocysteine lyase